MAQSLTFIGINYSPETTGIGPYTSAIATRLAFDNFQVSVITTQPHYPSWKIEKKDRAWSSSESLNRVSVNRLLHYVPRSPKGFKRLLSEVSFGLRVIFRAWPKSDAIILISPALISSAFAMLKIRILYRNTPVAVWVQDLYAIGLAETGQSQNWALKVISKVEGWLLNKADEVIVIHRRFAARIIIDYKMEPSKVSVLRNWVHIQPSNHGLREKSRKRFGWDDETVVVLHTGNMGIKQGLENVIDAAKLADAEKVGIRFVLMGDGGQRTSLEAASKGVNRIEFVDPVDSETYSQMLSNADVLLVNELPGICEMAVPSKLTSYFQSGTPVLAATAIGGTTSEEVLAAQAGLVVESGNPRALLENAMALGSQIGARGQYGDKAMEYAKSALSEEAAVEKFKVEILEKLLPREASARKNE
jgi:glycosyltransferase involved in cell wall biosynthesis